MPEGFPFPFPFFPGGGGEGDRHFRTPDGRDLGTNPSLEDVLNEYRRRNAPPPADVDATPPPNIADELPGDVYDPAIEPLPVPVGGGDDAVARPPQSFDPYRFDAPRPIPRLERRKPRKFSPGREEMITAGIGPAALGQPGQLRRQSRPSRPAGARARERVPPRGLPGFPNGLPGAAPPSASRTRLPSPSRTSGAVPRSLAFRGPRPPSRAIEGQETTPIGVPIPTPFPQKIGKPRERPEDVRARARILLDRIRRGENIGPLPDVNPNVPQTRPRLPAPPRVPAPAIPAPTIPAPQPDIRFPAPAPVPQTAPSIPRPGLPAPTPQRAPAPQRTAPGPRPRRVAVPRTPVIRLPNLTLGTIAASILRPIHRDQTQRLDWISPFSPQTPPRTEPGDAIAPPPATTAPPQIAPPGLQPLTPDNALALSLNPQATGTRRRNRTKDCECEETPEEKEANRRPSSKVVPVRTFRRRMSQNSLDNLQGK